MKAVLIIYTFDEIKQMKEYALQKSTNTVLEQQTLLNCFEVRNHLPPIHYILFHEKKNNPLSGSSKPLAAQPPGLRSRSFKILVSSLSKFIVLLRA